MRLSVHLSVTLLGLLAACTAWAASLPQAVQPGQVMSNRYLQVRVPEGKDWKLAASGPTSVSFMKPGKVAGESYLAQVTLFPLGKVHGKTAFMSYIRKGIKQDTPEDLFHPVSSELVYTQERGYVCARYTGLTEDHSKPAQGTLLLQVQSLYCQHPGDSRIGFVVAFMHRGKVLDKDLARQAGSFIQGVRAKTGK